MFRFLPSLKPKAKAKKEFGDDFLIQRDRFPQPGKRVVDALCDVLEREPETTATDVFVRSAVGEMRALCGDGVYVLYQLFSNDDPPFRLKFWYCGRYSMSGDKAIYDFE